MMSEPIPLWVFVWFGVIIACLLVVAVRRQYLIKTYGRPSLPADIQDLASRFSDESLSFVIVEEDFVTVERNGDRRLVERVYPSKHGAWHLRIEMHGDRMLAYEAQFKSAISWLLYEGRNEIRGRTIFITSA